MNVLRKSPLHDVIATLQPEWGVHNDMPAALQFDQGDSQRRAVLGIADVSSLSRCGLKGPRSAAWLAEQEIAVPAMNSWTPLTDGGLIARLGNSEFLLEDGPSGSTAQRMQSRLDERPHGVYPVLRQDTALLLTGAGLQQLLRQTCSFNFITLDTAARPVVLTTMVGVAVTLLFTGAHCRIWCDGTYGEYLWRTLLDIARELDGGATGLNHLILEGKS